MTQAAVGMRLQLLGLTNKGKQRLREFGTVWRVVIIEHSVLFEKIKGPWLFIEPLMEDSSQRLLGGRWINGRSDLDFSIVKEV